jgi:hypothetical protein
MQAGVHQKQEAHVGVRGADLVLHGLQALLQAQQLVFAPLHHRLVLLRTRLILSLQRNLPPLRVPHFSVAMAYRTEEAALQSCYYISQSCPRTGCQRMQMLGHAPQEARVQNLWNQWIYR